MQTATYTFANTQELKDHFDGKIERVEYGRYGNPTQRIAEAKLAALEGAEDCLLFASGMAAMTTALFAMLSRGTHVVVTDDSYRRTRQFLNQTLQPLRHRGVDRARRRLRGARGRHPADHARARERVADQPLQPHPRPRALRRDRPPAPGEDPHRRHVRHAVQPAAARVRRRPRHPLRHQVPRRPQRPAGRRRARLARAGGRASAGCRASRAPWSIRSRPTCWCAGSRPSPCAWSGRTPTRRRSRSSWPAIRASPPCTTRGCRATPSTTSPRSRCAASAAWCRSRCAGDLDAASRVVDALRIPYIAASLGGVESLIEQPAIMSFYELTHRGAPRDRDQGQPHPLRRGHRGRRRPDRRPRPGPRPRLRPRLSP